MPKGAKRTGRQATSSQCRLSSTTGVTRRGGYGAQDKQKMEDVLLDVAKQFAKAEGERSLELSIVNNGVTVGPPKDSAACTKKMMGEHVTWSEGRVKSLVGTLLAKPDLERFIFSICPKAHKPTTYTYQKIHSADLRQRVDVSLQLRSFDIDCCNGKGTLSEMRYASTKGLTHIKIQKNCNFVDSEKKEVDLKYGVTRATATLTRPRGTADVDISVNICYPAPYACDGGKDFPQGGLVMTSGLLSSNISALKSSRAFVIGSFNLDETNLALIHKRDGSEGVRLAFDINQGSLALAGLVLAELYNNQARLAEQEAEVAARLLHVLTAWAPVNLVADGVSIEGARQEILKKAFGLEGGLLALTSTNRTVPMKSLRGPGFEMLKGICPDMTDETPFLHSKWPQELITEVMKGATGIPPLAPLQLTELVQALELHHEKGPPMTRFQLLSIVRFIGRQKWSRDLDKVKEKMKVLIRFECYQDKFDLKDFKTMVEPGSLPDRASGLELGLPKTALKLMSSRDEISGIPEVAKEWMDSALLPPLGDLDWAEDFLSSDKLLKVVKTQKGRDDLMKILVDLFVNNRNNHQKKDSLMKVLEKFAKLPILTSKDKKGRIPAKVCLGDKGSTSPERYPIFITPTRPEELDLLKILGVGEAIITSDDELTFIQPQIAIKYLKSLVPELGKLSEDVMKIQKIKEQLVVPVIQGCVANDKEASSLKVASCKPKSSEQLLKNVRWCCPDVKGVSTSPCLAMTEEELALCKDLLSKIGVKELPVDELFQGIKAHAGHRLEVASTKLCKSYINGLQHLASLYRERESAAGTGGSTNLQELLCSKQAYVLCRSDDQVLVKSPFNVFRKVPAELQNILDMYTVYPGLPKAYLDLRLIKDRPKPLDLAEAIVTAMIEVNGRKGAEDRFEKICKALWKEQWMQELDCQEVKDYLRKCDKGFIPLKPVTKEKRLLLGPASTQIYLGGEHMGNRLIPYVFTSTTEVKAFLSQVCGIDLKDEPSNEDLRDLLLKDPAHSDHFLDLLDSFGYIDLVCKAWSGVEEGGAANLPRLPFKGNDNKPSLESFVNVCYKNDAVLSKDLPAGYKFLYHRPGQNLDILKRLGLKAVTDIVKEFTPTIEKLETYDRKELTEAHRKIKAHVRKLFEKAELATIFDVPFDDLARRIIEIKYKVVKNFTTRVQVGEQRRNSLWQDRLVFFHSGSNTLYITLNTTKAMDKKEFTLALSKALTGYLSGRKYADEREIYACMGVVLPCDGRNLLKEVLMQSKKA